MVTAAIVGTGRMGSAMAHALSDRGFDLVLHNRSRARADDLAGELGVARVVDSPAAAAAAADVIITMLADDGAVRSTFLDRGGLVEGARAGSVLVDMSTVEPSTILAVAPAVRTTGAGILDAPVSGSVRLASTGSLTVMVGGDAVDLERARPVLDALASTIFHLGPLGTGAAMKLAVNTLIFAINSGLSEALVLAEASGIERGRAYDVIAASAAGSPYVDYKRVAFLEPESVPVAFALDLAAKDLRLILGTARRLGLDLPQTRASHRLIRAAAGGGRGSDDLSTVAIELRSRRRPPAANGPYWEG